MLGAVARRGEGEEEPGVDAAAGEGAAAGVIADAGDLGGAADHAGIVEEIWVFDCGADEFEADEFAFHGAGVAVVGACGKAGAQARGADADEAVQKQDQAQHEGAQDPLEGGHRGRHRRSCLLVCGLKTDNMTDARSCSR